MYSTHMAKTQLSNLVREALRGEEVIIACGKDPVVKLVPVKRRAKKRVPGRLKGKIRILPGFFDPVSKDELADWGIE